MQALANLKEKKNLIVEVIILCLFLGGMYYAYTLVSEQSPTTTAASSEQLFGPNLTLLIKAVNQDHVVLKDISFLNSELVRQLQDFSEEIKHTSVGRDDPFVPAR